VDGIDSLQGAAGAEHAAAQLNASLSDGVYQIEIIVSNNDCA
jgi:hypothetical protein